MKNNLAKSMAKFSRLISTAEEEAKERCDIQDLTVTQLNYLEIIRELGNPTVTELASVMKLTKPSVTCIVDRLATKGFIRKEHSNVDKRSSFLYLTESGEQINKRHDYAHEYMAELITEKLNREEVNLFTILLDKVTNS